MNLHCLILSACLVASACLITHGALAQAVINRSDVMMAGDEIYFDGVSVLPSPGASGAAVTWDFSGIDGDSTPVRQEVLMAEGTPYFGQYPDANIALRNDILGVDVYQYLEGSGSAWLSHGNVVSGFTTLHFSDPRKELQFPLTYQTQWQDGFAFTETYDQIGVTYTGQGSLAAAVEGYGTLLLPQATFDDVLRVTTYVISMDTASLGAGLTEKNVRYDTIHTWLSPSYPGPLCTYQSSREEKTVYLITMDTIIPDHETNLSKSFLYDPMAQVVSAVSTPQQGRFEMHMFPNPFDASLTIQFETERSMDMQLCVTDLNGSVVYAAPLPANRGLQSVSIDTKGWPEGMLMAVLTGTDGADVRKIVHLHPGY